MELNKDVQDLCIVIRRFENKKWLKMATTIDLAKEINAKWCNPTELKSHYENGIIKVIKKINDRTKISNGILEEDEVDEILSDLVYILKGENTENDEN